MRETKYTREVLEPVVAQSKTFSEVIRRLGLRATGGNHRYFTALIRRIGIDTSHLRGTSFRARVDAIPRPQLEALAQAATSVAQILAALELPTVGRAHRELERRLAELAIDTRHLRGQGWARGETKASHPSVASVSKKLTIPDEQVFCERSRLLGGYALVPRLLAKGWADNCALCGISEWAGKDLSLHLDHINGIHDDNRLVNLRLLCPNCHSQTETYCRRGRWDAISRARERGGTVYARVLEARAFMAWGFESPRSHSASLRAARRDSRPALRASLGAVG